MGIASRPQFAAVQLGYDRVRQCGRFVRSAPGVAHTCNPTCLKLVAAGTLDEITGDLITSPERLARSIASYLGCSLASTKGLLNYKTRSTE